MFKRLLELLKDAATYGTANLAQKIAGFLLIPLYTRFLLPEDYGVIAMLTLLKTVTEILMYLGMKSSVFREFSLAEDEDRRRRVLSAGLVSVAVSATLVLLVSLLLDTWLASVLLEPKRSVNLIRVTMLAAALNAVCEVPFMALQANRQAKLVATVSLVRMVMTTMLTILLVVVWQMGVWGVVIAPLASSAVFAGVMARLSLKQFGWSFDSNVWWGMLRYGLPFVPYRLQAAALLVFGDYVVRHMLGLEEVGLYSLAMRFALPIAFVVRAVNQAWWPYKFHIFKSESDPGPTFRSITTYYVAIMSYLWVGVSLWGPEVLRLMTPAEFHPAAILVPAIALHRLLQGVFQMVGTGIELGDNARPIALVTTAGLVVAIPAAIWMVPWLHAMGAALAACLGTLTMIVAAYFLAQTRVRIGYDFPTLFGVSLLSLAIVATSILMAGPDPGRRIGINAALTLLYPVVMVGLLFWSAAERSRVRRLAKLFPTLWRNRKSARPAES